MAERVGKSEIQIHLSTILPKFLPNLIENKRNSQGELDTEKERGKREFLHNLIENKSNSKGETDKKGQEDKEFSVSGEISSKPEMHSAI